MGPLLQGAQAERFREEMRTLQLPRAPNPDALDARLGRIATSIHLSVEAGDMKAAIDLLRVLIGGGT